MNIYVGNIPYKMTEDELRDIFLQHGEVSSAKIIMDRESGRSKGFGFVDMPDKAAGEAAVQALNNQSIMGRNIRVNEARPRANRNQSGNH